MDAMKKLSIGLATVICEICSLRTLAKEGKMTGQQETRMQGYLASVCSICLSIQKQALWRKENRKTTRWAATRGDEISHRTVHTPAARGAL